MWISRLLALLTAVYVEKKVLDKVCIFEGWLLDKKVLVDKDLGFAHLILWISSDLSTLRWLRFFSEVFKVIGFPGFFELAFKKFFGRVWSFRFFAGV